MAIVVPNGTIRIVELEDRIEVRLDRPEARNAINGQMLEDIDCVLDDVDREPRFLVITGGSNGVFASGADLRDLRARGAHQALVAPNVRLLQRLRRAPLPTVAAIDGHALGGGAELAMACDFRVATGRSRFGQPEGALGVIPGAGGTWRLRSLVGESMARQMLLTGRVLGGAEALAAGLVDELVETPEELMPCAHALLDRAAASTTLSLRLMKLALDAPEAAHPEIDFLSQALAFERGEKNARIDAVLDRSRRREEGVE